MGPDGLPSREELLRQLGALQQRIVDLESAAADLTRTTGALEKESASSRLALERSEATVRALLESASEGILLVDANGRILLVNAGAERMFGYPREELVGAELERLLPERVHRDHRRHRASYFEEPRVRPMGIGLDLWARRRDGGEFPVEISLSHVESEQGPVALAFVTDITERKRVEAQLQRQREAVFQSEKLAALGRLVAGVAHEMNNPLGIVSSRLEVMLLEAEEQGLSGALVEDLQVLHRNTLRAAQIARSLRSFARHAPVERVPVDLNGVVDETLLLIGRGLATGGIELTVTLDRTLPAILGDASALHQVLLNLLANARDAMGGRGQISIRTDRSEQPGCLRLVVADTGPGIPAEHLPKIFDPFFTTKADGTGLGLSISYGIIQEHQGTVDVQSAPGEGAVFVLTFPLPPAD
jgi:PAS domain S-box-containing protein